MIDLEREFNYLHLAGLLAGILGVSIALAHYVIAFGKNYASIPDVEKVFKIPILGHSPFIRQGDGFLAQFVEAAKENNRKFPGLGKALIWFSPFNPVYFVFNAKAAKEVLTQKKWNNKGFFYKFLHDWLGTGLLTSNGDKWKTRRRMLTPAFHSKILNDFTEVMNKHMRVMTKIIYDEIKNSPNGVAEIDILRKFTLSTLDIICDTAMGKHISSQLNPDHEYVQAIYAETFMAQTRQVNFALWTDSAFKMLQPDTYKKHHSLLKILKDFTMGIIKDRIQEAEDLKQQKEGEGDDAIETETGGERKKLAFLDVLLQNYENNEIDLEGIREEVETFMFEGHDTTSSALSFMSYLLAENGKTCEKLQNELDEKLTFLDTKEDFYTNVDRFEVTNTDYDRMVYTDYSAREALRMFPPVPLITRQDRVKGNPLFSINNLILGIYQIGRDEEAWQKAHEFIPERWAEDGSSPVNNAMRDNAFSWIPFSAGSRNCIGQRFAMMEIKVAIAFMFKFFKFENVVSRQELEDNLQADIILRPKDTLMLKVSLRDEYK